MDEVTARRRGQYPAPETEASGKEQVLVTVSMDADLYAWLAAHVGAETFTSNVEQTVSTALRCLRGDLPVTQLVQSASIMQKRPLAAALFGQCKNEPAARQALMAAENAALWER